MEPNRRLPRLHKDSKEGDLVEVEVTVTKTGDVSNVVVLSTSNQKKAEELVAAIYKWKFKPATRLGEPVETKIQLPIRVP